MGKGITIKGRTDRTSFSEAQNHGEVRHTPTKAERRVIWNKLAKKYLRDKGLIGPKIPALWYWSLDDKTGGQVEGHCRSDARKAIKRILGIGRDKRLPIGITITKVRA